MFYKIEQENGNIVGIATSDDLCWCSRNGNVMLATTATAQFIQCDTKSYHANWMKPYIGIGTVEEAEVTLIDEETYNGYLAAIEAGEEILRSVSAETESEATTEDSSATDSSDDTESSDNDVSQTMPTYTELLQAFIALKQSNDTATAALADVTARLEALEGATA